MDFIFYTRKDGSVGSMPSTPKLKTEADMKAHCGDENAINFRLMRSPSFKCAVFSSEADTYVEDEAEIESFYSDIRTEACLSYQHSRKGGRCDSNFMALLTSLATKETVGVKAKACLDWLNALWKDEAERTGQNFDFSNHGRIPHKYSEVREEAENV